MRKTRLSESLAIIVAAAMTVCVGCGEEDEDLPHIKSPAKVHNAVSEGDLVKVVLTPEAEKRLGVQTVLVEQKPIQPTRTLGGVVMVPQGRAITVTAPLSGTILTADQASLTPGTKTKTGQAIFRLLPVLGSKSEVLSPSDRISLAQARVDLAGARAEAEGQVAAAKAQIQAAELKVNRADQLLKENAGSRKDLEAAQAELDIAKAALHAAEERFDVLKKTSLDAEGGSSLPLSLESPQDGMIREVHVAPGQIVSAGNPVFEVIGMDPLWIRVPVYVGELATYDLEQNAMLTRLSGSTSAPSPQTLKRVSPAPSGDPNAATIDLFFEAANSEGTLRPGQKVGVILPLKSSKQSLVVPRSAIIYDIHGGTWVYENGEPHVYVRRRVEVERTMDNLAVLSRGPAIGTKIVSVAAAEIFGTEFGMGASKEEDD